MPVTYPSTPSGNAGGERVLRRIEAQRLEAERAGRVDVRERDRAVVRDVEVVARVEERADARARIRCGRLLDRLLDARHLRHVPVGLEDDHARVELAVAELREGALVGFVAGCARNREVLEPAVGDLAGGEASEGGQQDPDADHESAVVGDVVGQALHRGSTYLSGSLPGGEELFKRPGSSDRGRAETHRSRGGGGAALSHCRRNQPRASTRSMIAWSKLAARSSTICFSSACACSSSVSE